MSQSVRYFLSYGGVSLPLKLLSPIEDGDIRNRNTYIRARYAPDGRLAEIEKFVYGEVTLRHLYAYHPNGQLAQATIDAEDGEEPVVLSFDAAGKAAVS